ncbi:MAG: hypothetical protein Q8L39_01870 [Burkholderiales bacterium]|nr:hypothetical protein [Burkholderiales bacterium]
MHEALVVFSRAGLFQTSILAKDVRSREHARKLWPLVAPDAHGQLLTWVSPSFQNGRCRRRSHFRCLPTSASYDLKAHFETEERERLQATGESAEHMQAKQLIAQELQSRLSAGLGLPWSFNDPDATDYHLEGNLLLGADRIAMEHTLRTPFGSSFRLDIAVLGPPIRKKPMVLGGIEIELGHAFDGRKALIGKSLGFPLISVDISDMSLGDITTDWARNALSATTRSDEQGRRRTYYYLHDLLYPEFTQLPAFLDSEQRHQYLIFADDTTLSKLVRWFEALSVNLGYSKGAVAIAIVNSSSEQSQKMLQYAGDIVGSGWQQFNDRQCLRITVPRPKGPADLQAHRLHMMLAYILLDHADALVGYKYRKGIQNDHPEENLWVTRRWDSQQGVATTHRVLPKRLAEPVNRLVQFVRELQAGSPHAPAQIR